MILAYNEMFYAEKQIRNPHFVIKGEPSTFLIHLEAGGFGKWLFQTPVATGKGWFFFKK